MSNSLACTFSDTLGATGVSCAVSGFGQSREVKHVIDVESQWQGMLTDIVHGWSAVTYPFLMKQDSVFGLRISYENSLLTAAILLLVCNDTRFFAFFPRVMKVSVRSLNIVCNKLTNQRSCPD